MSQSIPGLNELLNNFVEDCFQYLVSICDEAAKNSIYLTIQRSKNNSEISNKLYILEYYINDKEITIDRNEDILLLAKNYINYIYGELSRIGVYEGVTFISDYCLAYLALVCFRYGINQKSINDENFYVFDVSSYTNFSALLDKYMIKQQIKEVYEKNSKIIRDKEDKIGINKYTELFQIFDRNKIYLAKYEKKVVEINRIEEKNDEERKVTKETEKKNINLKEKKIQNNLQKNNDREKKRNKFESNDLRKSKETDDIKEKNESKRKNVSENSKNKNATPSIKKDIKTNKIYKIDILDSNKKEEKSKDKNLNKVNSKEKNIKIKVKKNSNGIQKKSKIISKTNGVKKKLSKNDLFNEDPKIKYLSQDKNKIARINIKNTKKEEENETEKNLLQINKSNNQVEKEDNINKEKQKEEITTLALKNEIDTMKFNLINLEYKLLVTKEQISYESIINSSLLELGKIKDEYLDTIIYHLKDTVTKLTNPYNINLWRKVSNIILKNLFVILKNKGFSIRQNAQKIILNNLLSYAQKNNIQNNEGFKKKISIYKNKLKSKPLTLTKNQSPAADKDRSFNIITLYKDNSPEIIGSLCIDFLFYLKELGNKVAHFDEKILDLILFDNLNIKEIKKIEVKNEEKKVNDSNDEYNNLTIEYVGKKEFTGNEILSLLNNPLEFQRKNIEIKDLFKNIYDKIDEFKISINYQKNKIKIDELETEAEMLDLKIKEIYNSYEAYFQNKKIDIKNLKGKEKNENINSDIKMNIKHYEDLKKIDNKISNKKKFYGGIKEKYNDINSSLENQNIQINGYMKDIKDAIVKTSKLINIKDIFDNYKEDLKKKIFNEQEYIENEIIFNQKNIDQFTINNLYQFIGDFLNSDEKYRYSIVKRDITNYNLYGEIIETFNELKCVYEKDVDLL